MGAAEKSRRISTRRGRARSEGNVHRVRSWFVQFGRQWQLQAMILPGIIFMIVFNFIPIYGLVLAFKQYTVVDTIEDAPWVGWQNFETILKDQYFWQSVVNTLGISFIKLTLGFLLPIVLAVMIYEIPWTPFKKIVQTLTYLPHFFSWIILGGMLINWLSTNGLLNEILQFLGFNADSNYLLDADKYWWIASLSDVWKEAGWGTILYLATMAGIDNALYEAAEIDGASKIQRIWNITIPGIRQIIILNLILTVSGLLGSNLDQTLVLMNSQNQPKAEVINSYVYRVGLSEGDFSYATAVGLGVSIVSTILLVAVNLVTKKINDNQSVL
ncbi:MULTISPECIES: ABC transporter permease [Bifidobacterium]|uniref:ABC transporter n=2 Tax=Bifidobacterium breve TaxID=1685 RepID=Q2TM37_BIFBR|nr:MULTISPECIES: ABC transporter permease subunit [Bifidobacterium]SPU25608.1 Raffinose transport system permease [Bifidobacterium bifidum]AAY16482.1 ABC transporter [Bifidobacterium breve]ABE95006.1 Permease protein of ABC transporter system for sugars [Bifidobacterium breve UCC2003]AUD84370.1 Permease protein of ABC transporter system for sugars [Bifidobacterium breve]MCM0689955.1 ABC transporter permease subunit [Bifidobacterium sp. M3-N-101]